MTTIPEKRKIRKTGKTKEKENKMKEDTNRRFKFFHVGIDVFVKMLMEPGTYRIEPPALPKDTTLIGVNYDYMQRCIQVAVKSEEFDEVPEGGCGGTLPSAWITKLL